MIVLDSHIWSWWLMQAHHRLPPGVQRCIEESPRTRHLDLTLVTADQQLLDQGAQGYLRVIAA